MKKRISGSVTLDEVFANAEKSPKWKAAYAKADIEVRMAIEIVKARERASLTQDRLAKAVSTTPG